MDISISKYKNSVTRFIEMNNLELVLTDEEIEQGFRYGLNEHELVQWKQNQENLTSDGKDGE